MSTNFSLTDELTRLPAQPMAAVRVLRLVEDRDASAADLARLIETDPALSARVMRLANAPYYGLTRKVASAGRAVVLLGFNTVRSLAVGAACGLLVEQTRSGPPGFWAHCVFTAAAASVVARQVGTSTGDAFSAGLLHDIGTVLLDRHAPERSGELVSPTEIVTLGALEAEHNAFGMHHAEVGAQVLESWRFPPMFVHTVAMHHMEPESVSDQLTRVVIAGEALGHLASEANGVDSTHADRALAALKLDHDRCRSLLAEVQREMGVMAGFLGIA